MRTIAVVVLVLVLLGLLIVGCNAIINKVTGGTPPSAPTPTPAAPVVLPTATPMPTPTTVLNSISDDGYTNVHPIDLRQCQSLSAGAPLVFKEYFRASQTVKIYAHDAKGTGEICRDVFDWGWRVVWTGFRTYQGAQQYALEEADRVLSAKDANPANPVGDVVLTIEVYNNDTLIKKVTVNPEGD